eukprot:1147489-Pelagomonas_calceolata.AAC.5
MGIKLANGVCHPWQANKPCSPSEIKPEGIMTTPYVNKRKEDAQGQALCTLSTKTLKNQQL